MCVETFDQHGEMCLLYVLFLCDNRELNSVTEERFRLAEGGQLAYLVRINELVNRKVLAASTLNTSSTNLLTQISTLHVTTLNKHIAVCVVLQVHLGAALKQWM